jgi:hypothetical protein
METYFPGVVEVRYYDALSPEVRVEHGETMSAFEERNWPYPVTLLDGKVVAVGAVSAFSLLQAVERGRRGDGDGQAE